MPPSSPGPPQYTDLKLKVKVSAMTSYQHPDDGKRNSLSQNHRKMLFIESGTDPEVAAERGYRTITTRTELLEFKKYQRRPGLYIPTYSPDGTTTSAQLRPDNPRKDKKGKALKYETPGSSKVVLDVHPRMREEVRNGDGDVWVTEGIKKADSLTSRGLPTIGLIGVWNWQRGGELLPCWDHVRLDGRRVYVVFDSDVMGKENVQLALERLVAALEGCGADVLVVYLPDAGDGSKQGVDDYLAAGHTVAELKMLARKFEAADVGRIRLSRDQRLRAALGDLERKFWAEEWQGMGGHTDRDVALKLIEAAQRYGKVVADGVRVKRSWGTLELESKVSRRTLWKAIARLEERGFLYRDNEGRKRDKSGAFVLRASVNQYGERGARKEKETQVLQGYDPGGLHLRAPRLMWSLPKWKPTKKMIREHRMGVRAWMPEPRDRIERLGKVRGALLDVLDAAGGSATVAEIAEVLHRKRPRDIRRRNLPALEDAGIVTIQGDLVSLTDNWLEALDSQRRLGKEVDQRVTVTFDDGSEEEFVEEGAETIARRRMEAKRTAYHERRKAPTSSPSAAGLAAVKRSEEKRSENIAEHEEHQTKARAAELEAKRFAKKFVYERVQDLGRIRLGLLQDVLRDAGGTPAYALPAAKSLGCVVGRLAEYENEEFIFAPVERQAGRRDEPPGLLDEGEAVA